MEELYQYRRNCEAHGWRMPNIGQAHSGPFLLAVMLQDPAGNYTAGSGVLVTNEVSFTNDDPTAAVLRRSAEAAGLPLANILPLNTLPAYNMRPTIANKRLGAAANEALVDQLGITHILCCGTHALDAYNRFWRKEGRTMINTAHPSRRGLLSLPNREADFQAAFCRAAYGL